MFSISKEVRMENPMFWIVSLIATIVVYRLLSRRMVTPQARVTAMLKRYHALERTGLSERDCLLQLLASRQGWEKFAHGFLDAIVSRLISKEDVMRFISLSEDHGYHRDPYPELAGRSDLDAAIAEIACLFSRFGFRLQAEGRYKEAEFVQKLALRLQPDEYFTNLPLAATYHETARYAEALPLFQRGFTHLKPYETNIDFAKPVLSPANCLAPDEEPEKLWQRYRSMYEACLKAVEGKSVASFTLLTVMELVG
jgi:tetratricopeptide (TPR) repeat protein